MSGLITRLRSHPKRATGALVALSMALALGGVGGANATPGDSGSRPATVKLGTANSFAVLAGTTVTNTATPTVINGNLGVSPGTAVTGFPPGIVENGSIHSADTLAKKAQMKAKSAWEDAKSRPATPVGPELGGLTLTPGVYGAGTLGITGTLTLSGNAKSVFIFQTASTLVTGPASEVVLTGGVLAENVFWQVGSSATLGVGTAFVGTVIALTSIGAQAGSAVEGRLLALNGAVTLDNSPVTAPRR